MSDFDGDDDHHMKWMSKKLEAIWQIVPPLGSSSRLKVWPDLVGLSGFCWENVKRELVHHQEIDYMCLNILFQCSTRGAGYIQVKGISNVSTVGQMDRSWESIHLTLIMT